MLQAMKRGLLVGGVVAVVAALLGASALAARGHGHAQFGVRAANGSGGPFGMFGDDGGFGVRGFGPGMGGPMFGGPGMRGGPFGMHGGPGMRGGGGGGLLASEVLKTASTYLGMSPADLATALKGGKTLADVAKDKGKTADGLIKALTDAAKANLDAAVTAGWITQKQADAVLEVVTGAITDLVNDGPGVPPAKRVGPLDAAATYLGMSVADLQTALKGGKTLAQVAADKGKTVDGLVTALTADVQTKLDNAVKNGDITQAQENTILTRLKAHVTDFVNGIHGPKATTTTTSAINKTLIKYTVVKHAVRR